VVHLPGLPLPQLRAGLVAGLTLATGTAVVQSDLTARCGLAAPHLARLVVKATPGFDSLVSISTVAR